MLARVLDRMQLWHVLLQFDKQRPRPVRAAIIHHDDLVRHLVKAQFDMEMLHGGANAAFLILGRDDDAEQLQRRDLCRGKNGRHSDSKLGRSSIQ